MAGVFIPDKGVSTPQPSQMGETGETSPIHVGVQHAPNKTELDHISPDIQDTCIHTGIRLMEVLWKLVESIIDTWINTVVMF